MLAQVKSEEEIISTYGEGICQRLSRMKNWIEGPHFPQELRITVRTEITSGLDNYITNALAEKISNCEWSISGISNAISSAFKENDIVMKDGYKTLYLAILGSEKGPRLAPILVELKRENILMLLG